MIGGAFAMFAAVVALIVLTGCGSSGTASASQVASAAGATSCTNSGYGIIIRASGDKQTIYNCSFDSGVKCVTYEAGIANDATEEVRLVFASTLGSSKPTCLQG